MRLKSLPTLVIVAVFSGVLGFGVAYFYYLTANRADMTVLGDDVESDQEIRDFVESYFSSWSEGNWDKYGGHFHDDATIYHRRGNNLSRTEKGPFINSQRSAVDSSRLPLKEVAENVVMEKDGRSASVIVYWRLFRGVNTRTGVDRFTLIRDPESRDWKIATLYWH